MAGSTRDSCMGSCWDSAKIETLLLQFLNNLMANTSIFGMTKNITQKDLNTLTPAVFKEIVKLIFQDHMTQDLHNALEAKDQGIEKLDTFNALFPAGFGTVGFDHSPVLLYQALSKLIPSHLDILRPSVVIDPSKEPMRTRKVLRYLTALILFVDEVSGDFDKVQEELIADFTARANLYKQLNEVKEEINKQLIYQDTWKSEAILLKRDSQNKTSELQSLEKVVTEWEEKVQSATHNYNKILSKQQQFARELEKVKLEIDTKSKLIVSSLDQAERERQAVTSKSQELNRERDLLGRKIDELSEINSRVANNTEDANKTISSLTDIVDFMRQTIEMKSSWEETQAEVQKKLQDIQDMEFKIENLDSPQLADTASRAKAEMLDKLTRQLDSLVKKGLAMKEALDKKFKEILTLQKSLALKQELAEQLKIDIEETEAIILVDLPQQRAQWEEMVLRTMNILQNEFSKF